MRKKSYVLVEVVHTMDGEEMNILAGTESKTCALRVLDTFKAYNAECAKRGIVSDTIIHSSVVDNPDYNAYIVEVAESEPDADKILSMVNLDND
jgi:hypothetical protein